MLVNWFINDFCGSVTTQDQRLMNNELRRMWKEAVVTQSEVQSSWNVMAHGDAREGKWRGNWRIEWVASTLHTTSEHGVSRITTADAHTSAAGSRLNWRPCRFKWTRPFRRKTKSGFCACVITFQTKSTTAAFVGRGWVKSICELRLEPGPPFELQSRSSKHAPGSLCTRDV